MWNAEGKMRNGKCGTMVISPQVRSRDRSYYAVYRTPRLAGAAVIFITKQFVIFLTGDTVRNTHIKIPFC